ncbi:MAG: antitoxin [Gaiellaceae bacterium]
MLQNVWIYDRRLQIPIDESRYRRVSEIARERETSVAAVVRGAIDLLTNDLARKRVAWNRIQAAEPMPVPDPEELKAELEEIRGGRNWTDCY